MDNKQIVKNSEPKTAEEKKLSLKPADLKVAARTQIVELAAAPDKILKQVALFEELKRKLLSEKDYQDIAGKRYIKKSGWRMFALAFNLSDEILKEERKSYKNTDSEHFVWEVTVRVTAPNGRYSEATASCASNEKRFAHAEHDVRATAHTRAKNRAIADLIGGGEVSAEEMDAPAINRANGHVQTVEEKKEEIVEQDSLATPKQLSFIKKLAAEKQVSKISEVTGVHIPDNAIPSKRQASEIIDKLMAL